MKKAVILFNLGGPDKLESVEPFLFNLFNDPAIISIPSIFRYPLAKFISKRRAPIAKNIYKEIGNKSPILELTPDWAEGWNKRATVLYLMGRYQESLKDIDEVLKRESRHFGALSGQCLVHIKLKNYEKAIKSYETVKKIYPSISSAKVMIPRLEKIIRDEAI